MSHIAWFTRPAQSSAPGDDRRLNLVEPQSHDPGHAYHASQLSLDSHGHGVSLVFCTVMLPPPGGGRRPESWALESIRQGRKVCRKLNRVRVRGAFKFRVHAMLSIIACYAEALATRSRVSVRKVE